MMIPLSERAFKSMAAELIVRFAARAEVEQRNPSATRGALRYDPAQPGATRLDVSVFLPFDGRIGIYHTTVTVGKIRRVVLDLVNPALTAADLDVRGPDRLAIIGAFLLGDRVAPLDHDLVQYIMERAVYGELP